jgi:hypothetical protein
MTVIIEHLVASDELRVMRARRGYSQRHEATRWADSFSWRGAFMVGGE